MTATPLSALPETYNYGCQRQRTELLVDLVIDACRDRSAPVRVLDVGCGRGIGRVPDHQRRIQAAIDEYWGLEPDASVTPAIEFDGFQHALMEDAELPADHFDVVYSSMVMEHVADPAAFLEAAHACLKPGGRLVFLTPNAEHYFVRISRLCKALRFDEIALRLIRGSETDEYHYPVQYRCNSRKQIRRLAALTGFEVEQIFCTENGEARPYFPGPLVALYWVLDGKRRLIRNPHALINLFAILRKPSFDS